jgi:hypothetical protein
MEAPLQAVPEKLILSVSAFIGLAGLIRYVHRHLLLATTKITTVTIRAAVWFIQHNSLALKAVSVSP